MHEILQYMKELSLSTLQKVECGICYITNYITVIIHGTSLRNLKQCHTTLVHGIILSFPFILFCLDCLLRFIVVISVLYLILYVSWFYLV